MCLIGGYKCKTRVLTDRKILCLNGELKPGLSQSRQASHSSTIKATVPNDIHRPLGKVCPTLFTKETISLWGFYASMGN